VLRGLVVWLLACVAFVGLDAAGLADDLALPVPLIVALVAARALAAVPWARRHVRVAAGLAVAGAGLALLALRFGIAVDPLSARQTGAALLAAAGLALALAPRAVRGVVLPPFGLDPGAPVHVVTLVAIAGTLLSSVALFAALRGEAPANVPFYATDSAVSIVSDVALALAGVGFLLTRGLRATLARLDLRPLTGRQAALAVVVAVGFHVVVGAAEWAESVWLPGVHALEDRFDYQFVGMPPLLGAVLVSVAAGVGEEILFRGALQPRVGVVLSAAVFAALHVQYQLPGILMIFAVGLGLGVLKRHTSTTFTAVVHVLYDLGAFLVDLTS
jgi:membrane protease YdiL (CAAX protease family)